MTVTKFKVLSQPPILSFPFFSEVAMWVFSSLCSEDIMRHEVGEMGLIHHPDLLFLVLLEGRCESRGLAPSEAWELVRH